MDNQVKHDKRAIILKYVAPAMGVTMSNDEHLIEELLLHSRLHIVVKFQFLEIPGNWNDGHIWLSIDTMAHSYYICQDRLVNCGRQIWKKQEFIFDSQSFYENQSRSDYIQAIEPGTFISIPYPALAWLQNSFPSIRHKLHQLSIYQQQYYRSHAQLLNKPTSDKVKSFVTTHPLFARVASNTINAMHIGLSRQGYENQIKKLR